VLIEILKVRHHHGLERKYKWNRRSEIPRQLHHSQEHNSASFVAKYFSAMKRRFNDAEIKEGRLTGTFDSLSFRQSVSYQSPSQALTLKSRQPRESSLRTPPITEEGGLSHLLHPAHVQITTTFFYPNVAGQA
jgi:hypothetical protein